MTIVVFKNQICGGEPQLQRSDRLLLSTQHYCYKDKDINKDLGLDVASSSSVVPIVAIVMIVAETNSTVASGSSQVAAGSCEY